VTCPACGGEATAWLRAPGSEPADLAAYELARCRVCGTAATTGAAPGEAAYASGIYTGEPPRFSRAVGALQRIARRLPLRMLRRAGVQPGAAVLDAGAGRGQLVAALREGGYSAEGIDPSPRGPGVTPAALEEHSAQDLDAVVLWHVLEHVRDPLAALERLRGWLGPAGVVLVAVPNLDSLQARIAGPAWFHLDLPRHRTHFTARGARELLVRAGLEPLQVRHLVLEHNVHGMWLALLGRLGMTPGFAFHLLKRNVKPSTRDLVLLFVAGPLLLVPAVLLELAAAALRRGGTIAIVAQRQGS
jgi:SAM-dependent methyltransferase